MRLSAPNKPGAAARQGKLALKALILALLLTAILAGWTASRAAPFSQLQEGQAHTIQPGEHLSSLAASYYGDSALWPAIWLGTNNQANEDNNFVWISDPHRLQVGDKVWIPAQDEAARLAVQYRAETAPSVVKASATPDPALLALTQPVTRTQIIDFVPQPPQGGPFQTGSCADSSRQLPWRADAWQCQTGGQIHDPCFQSPELQGAVICNADPAFGILPTFVLTLTQPLPSPGLAGEQDTGAAAWIVQLPDGSACSYLSEPTVVGSDQLSFGCYNPDDPMRDDGLVGGLQPGPVWTAEWALIDYANQDGQMTAVALEERQTVEIVAVWK